MALHQALQRAVRAEFPSVGQAAYLDTACIGIAPRTAVRAVRDFVDQVHQVPPDSGTAHHGRLNRARDAARPRVAELIGAQARDIALMESATHALNTAALALPLASGDVVAVPETEYIQMGVTWSQLESRGVKICRIPHEDGSITVDTIDRYLDFHVSALALSSVQWTTGFRADIASISELCRERGIMLLVDGAQHIGAVPFDVSRTPVDVLVSSGHKWLNSPFGTGFLYLSPGIRPRLNRPLHGFFAANPPAATWGEAFLRPDTDPFQEFTYTDDARAWETGGTANYPGGIGLSAAVDLLLAHGIDEVWARVFSLTEHLLEGLLRTGVHIVTPRAVEHRSGIVTFTTGHNASDIALAERLSASGVAVSVRYAGGMGGIRVSCHWFNSPADVDRLLATVSGAPQTRRGRRPTARGVRSPAQRSTASRHP
ncbi:aminotransferase class V-fold PLP-dependent enzyme [Streptomyces sp. HU2014]|uniref:Aminotransferase n=1 Tax=Streptomyces albireticuli TaxID=1940 RepID=A0A1Z2LE54_9ACTN|nr:MULTISPECIES: aminotransferase class V-fold PLP-dependent enzyme [Streptomyces]ARZ72569.1 aminotransferase [Streptomyces albireticuli]UQI45890.1 aminotransferase class V-fold PLP-dependent enzyme [Streptomyces sp. HU2014]